MADAAHLRDLGHAATLLGRLLHRGADPALVSAARDAGLELPGTPDDLAAAHFSLFHLDVFPHAGVYLGAERLVGGDAAEHAAATLAAAGFPPDDAGHAGVQLAFLGHLAMASAESVDDGDGAALARVTAWTRRFLEEDLLTWWTPFAAAVALEHNPWCEVVEVADALVRREADRVGAKPAPLPDGPRVLDDADAGLREVATWLATPAWSGVWLSRGALWALARRQGVPRGFADRVQTLENLLVNAVEHDALAGVLVDLDEVLAHLERHQAHDPRWGPAVARARGLVAGLRHPR